MIFPELSHVPSTEHILYAEYRVQKSGMWPFSENYMDSWTGRPRLLNRVQVSVGVQD